MRLVRLSGSEIALQFEFFNGVSVPVAPYDLGINTTYNKILIVDLPRATAYAIVRGAQRRLRPTGFYESNDHASGAPVPPGRSVTMTAVFSAPTQETTKMLVLVAGMLPVEVPVQPAGAAALREDPVLHDGPPTDPAIGLLKCLVAGGTVGTEPRVVEYRLPGDVLFEFGKATLTPAANGALDSLATQISGGGVLTIEGHTDSIGDDASNQTLSEQRAAAVRDAMQSKLGSQFSFQAAGFGESKPEAANTNPDGSDNPDGRAQNRRVEIRQGIVKPGKPPTLNPANLRNDLASLGLTASVTDVRRHAGFLVASVTVRNPTPTDQKIPYGNGFAGNAGAGGVTLADTTNQRRHQPCLCNPANYYAPLLWSFSDRYALTEDQVVPAGAAVTFWGIYSAPAPEVAAVDVELGGFGKVETTPITTG